jgi:hypothetical protein
MNSSASSRRTNTSSSTPSGKSGESVVDDGVDDQALDVHGGLSGTMTPLALSRKMACSDVSASYPVLGRHWGLLPAMFRPR